VSRAGQVRTADERRAAESSTTAARRVRNGRALARHYDVLASLTVSDLRARYGRGRLPFLKWLLDPFAVVGIYLVLVTFVLDRPGDSPGLSIACAVVPFQLAMLAVVNGMNAINIRRAIILNMAFPRGLIPVSSVLTDAAVFAAGLLLPMLMMAVYAVAPTPAIAWLPVVVLLNLILAVSWAYPAGLIGLWFPDLRPFIFSFVRTLFFLAPGLVALSAIEGRAHELVQLNPLTGLFESYRAVFLYGETPAVRDLLYPLGFSALLLAITVPVYRREERQFAKVL
jgi:homopolymeric O-antigen transport system permease protein